MGHHDLDEARAHAAALRRIVRQAGDGPDLRSLRRVDELSREAAAAVDDGYCREKLRQAVEFAAEMLAHGEHRRWGRGPVSGLEFLRRRALDALELFQSRLYSLELMRRQPGHGPAARARA